MEQGSVQRARRRPASPRRLNGGRPTLTSRNTANAAHLSRSIKDHSPLSFTVTRSPPPPPLCPSLSVCLAVSPSLSVTLSLSRSLSLSVCLSLSLPISLSPSLPVSLSLSPLFSLSFSLPPSLSLSLLLPLFFFSLTLSRSGDDRASGRQRALQEIPPLNPRRRVSDRDP